MCLVGEMRANLFKERGCSTCLHRASRAEVLRVSGRKPPRLYLGPVTGAPCASWLEVRGWAMQMDRLISRSCPNHRGDWAVIDRLKVMSTWWLAVRIDSSLSQIVKPIFLLTRPVRDTRFLDTQFDSGTYPPWANHNPRDLSSQHHVIFSS